MSSRRRDWKSIAFLLDSFPSRPASSAPLPSFAERRVRNAALWARRMIANGDVLCLDSKQDSKILYWVGMDLSPTSPATVCLNIPQQTLSWIYLDQDRSTNDLKRPEITRNEYKTNRDSKSPLIIASHLVTTVVFYSVRCEPKATNPAGMDLTKSKRGRGGVVRKSSVRNELDETRRMVLEHGRIMQCMKESIDIRDPTQVRVVIEGLVPDHNQSARRDWIQQQTGYWRSELVKLGLSFSLISNTTVKLRFAGHGHATKDDMWKTSVRRFPILMSIVEKHFQFSYTEWLKIYDNKFQKRMASFRKRMHAYVTASASATTVTNTTTASTTMTNMKTKDTSESKGTSTSGPVSDFEELQETMTLGLKPKAPVYQLPDLTAPLPDLVDALGIAIV